MPEKVLALHQQLALLPATVPDAIVDFLEDLFDLKISLGRQNVRAALMPEYLQANEATLRDALVANRQGIGSVLAIQVESIGKDMPQGYWCKLQFEKATRGLGFVMNLKEGKVQGVVTLPGEFSEEELKAHLFNQK